jgi:hypothetical protein
MRLLSTLVIALALIAPAAAGDEGLVGHWRFVVHDRNTQTSLWLVHLESKDGKLAAKAENFRGAPKIKVEEVKLTGDTLILKMHATIQTQMGPRELPVEFEGKLPKAGAKKILGTFSEGNSATAATLEATSAKSIFEFDRDLLTRTPSDPRAFLAIFDIIDNAKEHKVSAKDLQEWVEASLKAADLYGPKLQQQHQVRLFEALLPKKDYLPVAVGVARKVSKQLDPKMPFGTQLEILTSVADVLRTAKEKDETAAIEKRIEKLETSAYTEYAKGALDFKTPKFAGRKGKSKRAVLVELFTGAQCPPCVAADMAFDGLHKSYGPNEVVLLQYHRHIPRPDPLSAPESDARQEYYVETYPKKVGHSTPTALFDGKPDGPVGGSSDDAVERYKEFTDRVNKLLEQPAQAAIAAEAVRKGDKIAILAKVNGLEKPSDKLRMRVVLVEDWVRYKGRNGLQYHHRVVRAMPGGARGIAIKDKGAESALSVDLDDVRKGLHKYLDEDYEGIRPMRMRDFHVVVFVQNDETGEVLQALDVPVKEEK